MNTPETAAGASPETAAEQPPPACVMTFNASEPSGAGGLAGDVSTITAMGAHPLPVRPAS
jgi:hydroxymethylpyrimidine/phosphomethylpyrimidine kinase